MKSLKSQNYYEILGISRNASPEEIRGAYELSKQTFQEDSLATYSLFTDEENQEILALISRAYETLFNPGLRREYDAFLDSLDREGLPARDPRPGGPPRPVAQALRSANGPLRMRVGAPGNSGSVPPPPRAPSQPPPLREAAAPADAPAAEGRTEPAATDEQATRYIESVSCFTGPVLKKIRQMKGVSREQIAERTKIRKSYIEYLEEEQFRFLPAPVYIKGFVTMIAGMLDLPAQRVADDYMSYYRGNARL